MYLKISVQAFEAGDFFKVLGVFEVHFLIKKFLKKIRVVFV